MTACTHTKSGVVTSRPLGGIEDSYAATRVCDLPECIAEATEFVERYSHKTAHYVADEVTR